MTVAVNKSSGASNCRPANCAEVNVWPTVTATPLAKVTVPTLGSAVTVMVKGLLSASVGASNASGVSRDSSLTVMLVLDTTGAAFVLAPVTVMVKVVVLDTAVAGSTTV